MEQKSYELQLLFEIQGITIVDRVNGKQQQIGNGILGVYEIKSLNLYILKSNDWQYTLNKEIPIMKEQEKSFQQHIYVMPKEGGHYGITIPNNVPQQLIECLESVFQEHSHFVVPDQYQLAVDAVKQGHINDPQLQKQISEEEEGKLTSAKVGAFLHLGGDYVRQGLIQGAQLVSKGIKKGGQYLQTKITKPKPVKVDPSTMQKIRGAKTGSAIMLQYSRAQIQTLYDALKQAAIATEKEMETTETGVKIKSHKNYEDAKNIGKGTVHAVAAVYDGLFEALCEIGRGCGEATVGLVEKQYGEEASAAAKEGVGAVGNVGYIAKATGDIVRKDIVKSTENQTYGGVQPKLQ